MVTVRFCGWSVSCAHGLVWVVGLCMLPHIEPKGNRVAGHNKGTVAPYPAFAVVPI